MKQSTQRKWSLMPALLLSLPTVCLVLLSMSRYDMPVDRPFRTPSSLIERMGIEGTSGKNMVPLMIFPIYMVGEPSNRH